MRGRESLYEWDLAIHSIRLYPVSPSCSSFSNVKFNWSKVFAFRGHGVTYESMLERDFLSRTDCREDALSVVSQPVPLDFVTSSARTYTFIPAAAPTAISLDCHSKAPSTPLY